MTKEKCMQASYAMGWNIMIEDQEEINIECAILQGRIAYLQQSPLY